MPDGQTDYRFLVDEATFRLDGLAREEIESALDRLADQLQLARQREEPTGIVSGFEVIECRPGMQLFELLTGDELSRDCRLRIFGLLDKCGRFDTESSFYVEPSIDVEGQSFESYAAATAIEAQRNGVAVGLFGLVAAYGPGIVSVTDAVGEGQALVVTNDESRVEFYRWIYPTENVSEERFFDLAPLAFPRLRFADGVTFRRFEGSYLDLRESVVYHLGKINDSFRAAYADCNGRSDEVSAVMGLDISMESPNTRQSERLMRERDASYKGKTYRCEWHSKIEPQRNRIHLHPGDANSGECVLIGIFVEHLTT